MSMCLGWNTKATCAARPDQQICPGTDNTALIGPAAGSGYLTTTGSCDSSVWWLAAAAVAIAAVFKKGN